MVNFKEDERLNTLNHSCAHVMAQAVKHLYPDAKFWVGPVVAEGFYYDVDLGDDVIRDEDIPKIEKEMKKVANFLGEDYLRDCDSNEFYIRLDEIREAVGDRPVLRAIHFFNEEHNVKNAVSSLENGKFVEFLDAIRKSGNSSFKYLQNVYTTRDIQHQNISVALALSESLLRNYGVCRVHGGGFAGTIQAFVKNDFVGNYKEFINKIFGENSCHVLKVRKYGGIKVM